MTVAKQTVLINQFVVVTMILLKITVVLYFVRMNHLVTGIMALGYALPYSFCFL